MRRTEFSQRNAVGVLPLGSVVRMTAAHHSGDDFDIVCLGTVEWHVIRSVGEYTMSGFARSHRVLFVEPFGSWITLNRMARWQRRRRERKPSLELVDQNLWVYRPWPIGVPGISRWRWPAI